MGENKTEDKPISNWLDIGNTGINFGEVFMINFDEQNAHPIILHLKSGANISVTNTTSDMSDRELFQFLSNHLKIISESENRIKVDTVELLESILSELKLISRHFSIYP